MGLSWQKYNDIDYLLLDYRGLDDIGILELTLDFSNILDDLEDNSLYLLIDATGLNVSFKNYTKIKDTAKTAQSKIKKSVYVGLSAYSKTLYNVYKKFTDSKALLLDTKEEAFNYFEEN